MGCWPLRRPGGEEQFTLWMFFGRKLTALAEYRGITGRGGSRKVSTQHPGPPQKAPGDDSWLNCVSAQTISPSPVSCSLFSSLLAVRLKSRAAAGGPPWLPSPPACTPLSPGRTGWKAGGSSTFHAECIKVPVNCALTSQGELGKAPLGLVLLGGPAGESITGCPGRQQP